MSETKEIPEQHQTHQPGLEAEMIPLPESAAGYKGSGKLTSKVAIITGGDSGIGRAVSIAFAKEGADIAIVYLNEHEDANSTKKEIEQCGQKCLLLAGDLSNERFCKKVLAKTISSFGHIEIVINNAAEQHVRDSIADTDNAQLERTFRTNIFPCFI